MTAHERLQRLLISHEGLRYKPYRCTEGKLTIGVGRNLDDRGLSDQEIHLLLNNDIALAAGEAEREFPWFKELDQVRQDVIVSMIFNMGIARFKGFKKTIELISRQDFYSASIEILDSRWSKQVGERAIDLSEMLRSGQYPAHDPSHG